MDYYWHQIRIFVRNKSLLTQKNKESDLQLKRLMSKQLLKNNSHLSVFLNLEASSEQDKTFFKDILTVR